MPPPVSTAAHLDKLADLQEHIAELAGARAPSRQAAATRDRTAVLRHNAESMRQRLREINVDVDPEE